MLCNHIFFIPYIHSTWLLFMFLSQFLHVERAIFKASGPFPQKGYHHDIKIHLVFHSEYVFKINIAFDG